MSEKLTQAKVALLLDHPFFASLLLSMPIEETDQIPTAGTDGKRMLYNKAFIESLSVDEVTFVLAHEVLHAVFEHMYRRGTRNQMKFNIAADYVINEVLVDDRVGAMPKDCLFDRDLTAKGGYTTEGVYDLLPDSESKRKVGGKGGPLDLVEENGQNAADNEKDAAEMKVRVAQAAHEAKMRGKLSQRLQRLVGDAIASKTDWKQVLRNFLSIRAKVDWSFAKPKRRFMANEEYLPSLIGEKLGEIVIAIDCSGSIGNKELSEFSAEIKAIVQDTSPSNVHVLYFDSAVLGHASFEAGNDIELSPMGGGGTAFSPIWEYIDTNQWAPVACIVLTDLQCNDFGQPPSYPLMWATNDSTQAPFGDVIKIKDNIR